MAHFAKLDENNNVIDVITVNNQVILDNTGKESEQLGINFLTELFGYSNWKQTSFNNKFRKQYAGVGFTYDPVKDIFISIQPFPSFKLDSNSDWQAPVPYPTDGLSYDWDESNLTWVLIPQNKTS